MFSRNKKKNKIVEGLPKGNESIKKDKPISEMSEAERLEEIDQNEKRMSILDSKMKAHDKEIERLDEEIRKAERDMD